MNGLNSFFIFICSAFFLGGTEISFSKRADGTHRGLGLGLTIAGAYSTILAVIHFFMMKLRNEQPTGWAGWEILFSFLLLGMVLFLVWRFAIEGNKIKEFLGYLVVAIGTSFFALQAASYGSSMAATAFGQRFAAWIPWLVICFAIGALFFLLLRELGNTGAWWIALIIGGVLLVLSAIILLPNWGGLKKQPVPEPEPEPEVGVEEDYDIEWDDDTVAEDEDYWFYNTDLQYDDDPENNLNFGFNPLEENPDATAEEVYELYHEVIRHDPLIAAADLGWTDSIVKTRFIGQFYDEVEGQWDKALNDAKDAFWEDHNLHKKTIVAYEAFCEDTVVKVELRYGKGIKDQMYANPYTVSGVPDVIVLETTLEEGWFLVITHRLKNGDEFEVPLGVECLFQPRNAEKVMDIKPQPKPTPVPPPTASGNNPPPTPDPKKDPVKDKTKGTKGEVVKPNDNPGPGPDTNNPDDSNHSKVEEHPNSTEGTYEEYKEKMKELDDANKKEAEPTKPSTPAPSKDTKVDDKGSDSVKPDPNTKPSTTEDGKIKNSDKPAGQWEGPPD